MAKTFNYFEVRREGLVLSAFGRLIEAVRYWRNQAKKNGQVVRVTKIFDENGSETKSDEFLID